MAIERISFWELFKLNGDGSLEPLHTIRIGGVQFGPGVKFTRGVSFSGIDLFRFVGKDLQVEKTGDKWIIRGIYNS